MSLSAHPCASLVPVLLLVARTSWAQTDAPLPPRAVPAGVRSVHVLREGEVLYTRPDASSPRRGTAARDALLPALQAVQGPGCQLDWVSVGREAWVCLDEAHYAGEAPTPDAWPPVAGDAVVPYAYAFAADAGVRTFRRLDDVDTEDWAEELERGMAVAIVETSRWNGRTYAHTASGRWIAQHNLNPARPSTREGAAYESGESTDGVGFAMRNAFLYGSADEAARAQGHAGSTGFVTAREAMHVRERSRTGGHDVVRTDRGWMRPESLRTPTVPAPPTEVTPQTRWVDVDLRRQLLVALEGTRPVYTALVSSGRQGHATERGLFHVWIKLGVGDMSNADREDLDTTTAVYSVERVPWVMYFHNDQALHGAYWHDRFGTVHSHGCVNLAPRDARWLYAWAPPAVPPGWSAILPTSQDPGLVVRVR